MTQTEHPDARSGERDDEAKWKVVNRLRLAHGQLALSLS